MHLVAFSSIHWTIYLYVIFLPISLEMVNIMVKLVNIIAMFANSSIFLRSENASAETSIFSRTWCSADYHSYASTITAG